MLGTLQLFYSLWITAIVAEGFHGEELIEHFKTDALEELGHAEKLANRILELGGSPVVDPGDWAAGTGNAWVAPRKDFRDADRMVADQVEHEEFLENLVGNKGRARGTKASRAKKTR